MSKGRRKFTDEFKREAVRLCSQPGAVVTQVARNIGVDQSVLRRWVQLERDRTMEMSPSKPLRSEAATELERVQRELRRVTMERDILKKRSATSRRTRSEVRLHCQATRDVAHASHLPTAGCVAQRVLRMVRSRPEYEVAGGRQAHAQHPPELRTQRPHLRQPTCVARPARGR